MVELEVNPDLGLFFRGQVYFFYTFYQYTDLLERNIEIPCSIKFSKFLSVKEKNVLI